MGEDCVCPQQGSCPPYTKLAPSPPLFLYLLFPRLGLLNDLFLPRANAIADARERGRHPGTAAAAAVTASPVSPSTATASRTRREEGEREKRREKASRGGGGGAPPAGSKRTDSDDSSASVTAVIAGGDGAASSPLDAAVVAATADDDDDTPLLQSPSALSSGAADPAEAAAAAAVGRPCLLLPDVWAAIDSGELGNGGTVPPRTSSSSFRASSAGAAGVAAADVATVTCDAGSDFGAVEVGRSPPGGGRFELGRDEIEAAGRLAHGDFLRAEVEGLLLRCVNADPNYGSMWFHCRHRPSDTAK